MVRSLFYVLILLLLYFIVQFIFFPTPPKLLAKQICIAPSGCRIEMDTGFCPNCIEVKEEPPIIKEKVIVEKKPVVKVSNPPLYPRVNESLGNKVLKTSSDRKPNKRNWVGTLFKCIVGCKEGVSYWDEGGNEFDENRNLISTN